MTCPQLIILIPRLSTQQRWCGLTSSYFDHLFAKSYEPWSVSIITRRRRYSFAEYWKHFIARLNRVHAFGYNSAGSEPIRMKFRTLWVHCLAGSGRFWVRSAQKWQRESEANFCFFLSGKQRTTLPIFSLPNFTKFAHKTWICEAVNRFRNFENLPARGRLFPKMHIFRLHRHRLATSDG